MHYYLLAIKNSPLLHLTYKSETPLQEGTVVSVVLQNREVSAVVMKESAKPEFETSDVLHVTSYFFSSLQIRFARFVSEYYVCSLGEVFGLLVPFDTGCTFKRTDVHTVERIELSEKQAEALAFIKKQNVSLLFGDTGSGKTEIYMKLFFEVLKMKKQVLFLMPEISLTPQMEQRLQVHFGSRVAMWHSKITKPKKEKILKRILCGEVDIIAGARSALFTPLHNIGLIVVDEEHDDSYKSASKPRYNARDLAIYMGQLHGARVLLGSATPSLGSYVKFPSFRLRGGHFGAKRKFVYERSLETISPLIEEHILQNKKEGAQSIVFIPTRANFKYLICANCGYKQECPFCSVGMSVHQKTKTLKCHYCNFTVKIPQVCPECGEATLKSTRLGTAEATEQLLKECKDLHVEQFDRDVITTQKKLTQTLQRFDAKEIDVLVGTQMLSKGHDYHDVTLAVVLGLDNLLGLSDYRAREKALSSLIQIAGRSGRKKEATVIVQSFNEEFFNAYVEDYEQFLKDEQSFRIGIYPPFAKLCRILFAHKNGAKARQEMETTLQKLKLFEVVQIVGSGVSSIEKIAGKYRFFILLRAQKSTDLIKAARTCKSAIATIDMDPIEFA